MAVKKLRIIPRRKLKSTNSLRGAMYMQVGADYVRHVSSLVKSGINSLKLASFSLTPEGLYSLKQRFSTCFGDMYFKSFGTKHNPLVVNISLIPSQKALLWWYLIQLHASFVGRTTFVLSTVEKFYRR